MVWNRKVNGFSYKTETIKLPFVVGVICEEVMEKLRILCAASLLLSGCAAVLPSVSDYQARCSSQYRAFPEVVSCTNSAIRADGRPINPDTQEYMLLAEVMVEKVGNGSISENEARLALLRRLNEMRAVRETAYQQRAAALAAMPRPTYTPLTLPQTPLSSRYTTRTSCYRYGDSMDCTTR